MVLSNKTVVVITGPTGIGKTGLSIQLAQELNCPVISADSRQIFREMKIGTAAPNQEQLELVPHFLIGTHSIFNYYSAYEYEQEALAITNKLFQKNNTIILTGGSMLYIDAFCNGIDDLPTIDPELRENLQQKYRTEGIESIRRQLKILDPDFYTQVDLKNPKRVIHAVEICLMTGRPYSELRTNTRKKRPFRILKTGLDMDRTDLHQRINARVDKMVQEGLEEEAVNLYPHKELNALNTVGYREFFDYFDKKTSREKAIELIKRNSRRYARKQLSWFRRDKEINWFDPKNPEEVITFVNEQLTNK
ncbi:tRNA (adenosine(37)-N6)-dimethylallyltransferase MiaA [Marinilabilia salmonicolor]|uniref:tRNA (adenosine(37)-N6)-dimethylallyltransferase MiaA n=1 Tax=Marinilabilia salmonicolor TaxID=989 RepID=UPI00029A716A|nr:tRNA (adenosine(37)-N6)-dimethylallyltransferase MiaA [Marinilabilia salmonicolor]